MTREDEELLSVPEQAARWWRVMQDEEPTAAEKREFAGWVAESPKHIEEMLRMARVHKALSKPDVRWPADDVETLIREARAASETTIVPLSRPERFRVEARRPARLLAFGLAATVLLAAGIAWLMPPRAESFQTKIGEQRSLMLADGSRVTLNTASRIEVRLLSDRRIVELVSGEALFEVAHDARRPFDVRVGPVVARAVGTQFEVDRRATQTTVTVVEGKVAVSTDESTSTQLLSAGNRVVVDRTGPKPIEQNVNLSDAVAWTERQLVFRRRSLQEVAEEFNRYNVGQVEIHSPTLQKQEVTGIFRTDDVASFVALLAGKPGVRVEGNGSGGYVVTLDETALPRE